MKEKITIEKLPSVQNENIGSLYKYISLINKCLDRSLNKEQPFKYEIHHIIPKSFGGSNSTKNLVKLDLKEHFLAHLYLSEAYKNTKYEHKTYRALWCMANGKLDSVKKFDEFDYEILRKGFIVSISGENNPRYGKSPYEHLDEEQLKDLKKRKSNTWKKMTNKRKKEMTNKRLLSLDNRTEEQKIKSHEKRVMAHSGENNGFYGKKHSEETKKKISEKQKSISIEERQKRSEKMKQTLENKTDEEKLIMKKNRSDAQKIAQKNRYGKPVLCLNDKKTFKSLKEAGLYYKISYKLMKTLTKHENKIIKGYSFQIIDKNQTSDFL